MNSQTEEIQNFFNKDEVKITSTHNLEQRKHETENFFIKPIIPNIIGFPVKSSPPFQKISQLTAQIRQCIYKPPIKNRTRLIQRLQQEFALTQTEGNALVHLAEALLNNSSKKM